MKNYTEPKLEVIVLEASDVITTSGTFKNLFQKSSFSYQGRGSSIDDFKVN